MIFRESEFVELKEMYVEDIKKEIIAFAICVINRYDPKK